MSSLSESMQFHRRNNECVFTKVRIAGKFTLDFIFDISGNSEIIKTELLIKFDSNFFLEMNLEVLSSFIAD